jgi:hypothetical protein
VTGSEAADGGSQSVFRARHLEGARHDRLHVAVAVVAQSIDNALARNDADQLRAANDGEVFLQRVNAAEPSASASVSEGESVAKSVSITSRICTVSTTDWKKTP